ncbi:hypothetical protein ACFQX7_03460 [Luedemannella flava]
MLVLLAGGGAAYVLTSDANKGKDSGTAAGATTAAVATATSAAPPTSAAETSAAPQTPSTASATPSAAPALAPDEECSDEIKANERWVCITDVTFDGKQLVIRYAAEWAGSTPNKRSGYHVHFYSGDGTDPAADVMGTQADDRGSWYIEDQNPSRVSTSDSEYKSLDMSLPKICARIARSNHNLVADDHTEHYRTGNCWPIRRP